MKLYNALYAIVLALLFISCSEKKDNSFDSEEFLSFNTKTLDNKEYEVNLSDLMESVEIVRMDKSTEEAFTTIFKVEVSNNFFAIWDSGREVKLYSKKDGKFLGNIGKRGQGPGEYSLIWEAQIDEARNRIFVAPFGKNYIYSYDLNGHFYESENIYYPKEVKNTCGYIYLNPKEDKMIVFQTPYLAAVNTLGNRLEAVENACWIQDFKGNITHLVPSDRFSIPRNSSTIWASHINQNSPVYSYTIDILYNCRADTLYHYNASTNDIYPVFASNLPAAKLTTVVSRESPLHYYTLQQKFQDGTDIDPEYSREHKLLQVDKRTKEGRYIRIKNDFFGGIEIDPLYWFFFIRNDYVVHFYEPLALKEELEEALENNKELDSKTIRNLTKFKNSLKENDNNIMMICKFKK